MTPQTLTVTLTGSAQSLTSNLNVLCLRAELTADPDNAEAIKVGSLKDQPTASTWGKFIPAPVGTIPAAPMPIGDYQSGFRFALSDLWVIGAAFDVLHVFYWTD